MKRLIFILLIFFSLVGGMIWEQIFINKTIVSMQEQTNSLHNLITSSEQVDTPEILTKLNSLQEYWSDKENTICLLINHKDIENIGEQIEKLVSACEHNNKEQSDLEVHLLKYYVEGSEHVLKVTFQNIW